MSITVKDAISLEGFNKCRLIAGSKGLDRPIIYIDAMEVPNYSLWVRRGILVITTGYAMKNQQALQELIRSMHDADAAGLAIKTKFLGPIKDEVIQLADDLKMPLLEIPTDMPFVELTTPLMKTMVNHQSLLLEYSLKIHDQFSDLELQGGNIQDLTKMVSDLLNMPVFIIDQTGNPVAQTAMDMSADQVSAMLSMNAPVGGGILELNRTDTATHYAHYRAVRLKGKICAYIITIHTSSALNEMQLILIDHAATSVALEYSKHEMLEEHVQQISRNLFLDLILKNVKTEEEAKGRASLLGWLTPPFTLAVLDIRDFETFSSSREEIEILQIKTDIEFMIMIELSSKCISTSDTFSCLIPSRIKREPLTASLGELQNRIYRKYGITLTAGVVSTVNSYLALGDAYNDAQDAIQIERINPQNRNIIFLEDAKLEQALLHSQNNQYLIQFCDAALTSLEQYDKRNNTDLLHTLEVLIDNMGVRTKTADALYLHRNTLLHRIQKIEQLTGRDLSRSKELTDLALALRMRPFIMRQSGAGTAPKTN